MIDDALVIDGNAAASFTGVLNPALPLGQPIDTILGSYPPRDLTTLFLAGISKHYFECVDTHRSIAGNTELWLVIQ